MKIAGEYAQYFSQVFERALQEGDRYACITLSTDETRLPSQPMRFFHDKEAAMNYGRMRLMSNQELIGTIAILPMLQQLNRNIELQQLDGSDKKQLSDVFISTRQIEYNEMLRAQIFKEEITRQLRDNGFRPDQQKLQEHINKDEQSFSFGDTRLDQGFEKPYTIYIKQDEKRAFAISSIEQQINSQHKSNEHMKSEVLEGAVRPKDAAEIKATLEKEKEEGYRFVSFPANKNGLAIKDFAAFKSPIVAYQHAKENTNAQDKYLVCSIAVVEKEMDRILENKQQHIQEDQILRKDQRNVHVTARWNADRRHRPTL